MVRVVKKDPSPELVVPVVRRSRQMRVTVEETARGRRDATQENYRRRARFTPLARNAHMSPRM